MGYLLLSISATVWAAVLAQPTPSICIEFLTAQKEPVRVCGPPMVASQLHPLSQGGLPRAMIVVPRAVQDPGLYGYFRSEPQPIHDFHQPVLPHGHAPPLGYKPPHGYKPSHHHPPPPPYGYIPPPGAPLPYFNGRNTACSTNMYRASNQEEMESSSKEGLKEKVERHEKELKETSLKLTKLEAKKGVMAEEMDKPIKENNKTLKGGRIENPSIQNKKLLATE